MLAAIKERWQSVIDKYHASDPSTGWLMEIGAFALGGLIAGFLLKHFARFVILGIICTGLLLWVLNYYDVVSINYSYVKALYGASSTISLRDLIDSAIFWVRNHIGQTIAACVGFFISWELA